MNSLIQITKNTINGAEINSVNAREIHEYLKVKTKFADWIKRAIEKYDFIENQDFIVLKNGNGTNAFIDYIVTLDMGKELAMLENNPKGKEIRKEFIEIEKKYYSQKPLTLDDKISLIAQGHQEVNTRLLSVETEVDYLKNKSPILYNQLKVLEDKRKSKTKQLVGYNPESNQSKKNYSKTISRLTKKFKDKFNISRYADLPKDKFEDALLFLNNIEMVDLI